jgi:ABC-2 type transporter
MCIQLWWRWLFDPFLDSGNSHRIAIGIQTSVIQTAVGWGYIQVLVCAAYITPNQDMAFVISTAYVVLSVLLAGFLVKLQDLLWFMRVISVITPARYGYQILIKNQFYGTSRASTLNYFDIRVPEANNFAALLIIYFLIQLGTWSALQVLHRKTRK